MIPTKPIPAETRGDPREHLLIDHPVKLPRYARHEEEQRLLRLEHEPGCGADRVRENLRALGEVGLLRVVLGHLAPDRLEEAPDPLENPCIAHELAPQSSGGHLGCDVVSRGPETTRDEDHPGSPYGRAEHLFDGTCLVGHRHVPPGLQVEP